MFKKGTCFSLLDTQFYDCDNIDTVMIFISLLSKHYIHCIFMRL